MYKINEVELHINTVSSKTNIALPEGQFANT